MTVMDPPRRPQPHDALERSEAEALIAEARRRARRRRAGYAVTGALLVFAGWAQVTSFGGSESAGSPPAAVSVPANPAVAASGSKISFGIYSGGHHELYVVNADGSGLRLLTRFRPKEEGADGGAWSPDGRKIAIGTTTWHGLLGTGNEEVMVVNADGSGERVLTGDPASDQGHAWSPDGAQILFGRAPNGTDDGGVFIVNADGSGQRKLADGGVAVWSPDGQTIAFGRDHSVWVMNTDGSPQRRLTSGTAVGDLALQWSPDGAQILFMRIVELESPGAIARADLYTINADGSGERRVAAHCGSGVWSPDSQKIACSRRGQSSEEDVPSIHVVNADGTGERMLAEGGGPAWSPDGQEIAFARDHSVWVMNADGTAQRRLTPAMGWYGPAISWSPAIAGP